MLNRITVVLILAVIAACSSARTGGQAGDIQLQVRPTSLAPGDSLTVVLANRSSEPIGYNLCPTSLERREGNGWSAVRSDRICTLELRTLEPGAEDSFTFALPTDLAPGDYRAVTNIERLETGEPVGVTSETFRIA